MANQAGMSEVNMYAKKVMLWQSEEQSSLEIKKTEHAKLMCGWNKWHSNVPFFVHPFHFGNCAVFVVYCLLGISYYAVLLSE